MSTWTDHELASACLSGGMISARAGAGESTKRATFDRGSGP